jgi:hypothetical protein
MNPRTSIALALFVAACGGSPADAGRDTSSYADPSVRALHNLGPLGASAHPATRDISVRIDDAEHHPGALVLRQVLPGGPLAAAGLQPGDAIVQVGGELLPNKPDPTLDLIAAIETRLSKGAPLALGWLRRGELRTADVALDLPPLERGLPGPIERFDRIAEAALARLAALQQSDGSIPVRGGDRAATLAATGLAGLAFVAGGSGLREGRYADQVRACHDRIADALRDAQPQDVFGDASALLFVAELAAQSSTQKLQRMLQLGTARLLAAQGESGGWSAPQSGRDVADLATNLALLGLGMAERAGAAVPPEAIVKGCHYLGHIANDGHVGRSTRADFDRRNEAGRCAGTAVALRALGCSARDPLVIRLLGYAAENGAGLARAPLAAPLHVLSFAVASRQSGLPAWQRFWAGFRHLLVAVQAADGSCRWLPRPGTQDLPFEGEAWDTACVACIAALQHERVPVLLGRHAGAQPVRDASGAPTADGAAAGAGLPEGFPGDAQMIEISSPEDLAKQLEALGMPKEQIDAMKEQLIEQIKEKKDK